MTPRVLVTRPTPEAEHVCAELAARDMSAVPLPLIEIAPLADSNVLPGAWSSLDRFAALFFVSSNAVRHFFEQKPTVAYVDRTFSATDLRAWAPGPGTARALRAAGVPLDHIDAPAADAPRFDSEALWDVVRPQAVPGARVLIVRGADALGRPAGRDWLALRLREAAVDVDAIAAYRRRTPCWTAGQLAQAHSALADGAIWLFSSSEAIANLRALLPGAPFGRARAIATHPRIAQAARDAGFGVVCASRPDFDSLVRSIKSIG